MRVSRPRLGPSPACVRVALVPPRPGSYRSTASRRPAPGPVGWPRWGRMGKALRIFFRTEGANPWVVVLCLLLAGLFEGVSIASLLPVLSVAQGGTVGKGGGQLGRVMGDLLDGASYDTSISILLGIVLLGIALKAVLTWLAMRYVGYAVAEVSTRLR